MSFEPQAKKSLGQHWLTDKSSLSSIVQAGQVKKGDVVLEIGPGQGTLTDELLQARAEVIALEYDSDLIKLLQQKYKDHPTTEIFIQEGDIRSYDFGTMLGDYKIVANIPYYLTANLLRKLIDTTHKPTIAALLVQKEVAERVAAKPGQMSFIAVATQLYYEVSLGQVVEAEMFTPPPKVDSQVLVLNKLTEPTFTDVDQADFLKFIKIGFAQPRKTLANNLTALTDTQNSRIERSAVEAWLSQLNLPPTARAQELTLSNWHNLFVIGPSYHKLKN